MQLGFYFDQSRCTGCYACVVACRDWNNLSDIKVSWRKVTSREWGRYPEVKLAYLSLSCSHCNKPACADACPVKAISKREADGIVFVDREQCLGSENCGAPCKNACPYEIPQFGEEENPRMQKCHFCLERWEQGKKPVCVDACPVRALDARPLEELMKIYEGSREANGFKYSEITKPSLIIKPRYGS